MYKDSLIFTFLCLFIIDKSGLVKVHILIIFMVPLFRVCCR